MRMHSCVLCSISLCIFFSVFLLLFSFCFSHAFAASLLCGCMCACLCVLAVDGIPYHAPCVFHVNPPFVAHV